MSGWDAEITAGPARSLQYADDEAVKTLLDAKDREIKIFRELVAHLRSRCESREKQVATLTHEREGALVQAADARSEAEARERAIAPKARALALREEKLRRYAAEVEAAREETRKAANQVAEELTAAWSMHPLKDYLSLTEFELVRTENELKRIPASSDERPRVEASLKQLLEQKRFLKGVIETSQAQLSKRAQAMKKLCSENAFTPLFPLAPEASQD